MTKNTGHANIETNEPHWIEWTTGTLSALVILAVLIWIGRDALMDRDTSPDLGVSVLQVEARSNGFQVLFEIQNRSSQTASQVTVRGEVFEEPELVEAAETVTDYVPGHSKAVGGLIFKTDPRGRAISIRAISFNLP